MGMHFGIIAAPTTSAQLRDAFLQSFSEYDVVDSKEFGDAEAMENWCASQKQFVSAADWTKERPGKTAFMFWQDGPWAAMWDEGYVHSADEEKMADLSTKLGKVLAFVVESTSGCAFFVCYEQGVLRRKIDYNDGEATLEGSPLPEEAGINVKHYYMDETERLLAAFGISSLIDVARRKSCLGVSAIDRTDYSKTNVSAAQTTNDFPVQKPWWKFW